MKKKGFTLIELLGVILILGLIAIISVPPVLKEIKKSKNELSESTKTLIIDAAKDYYEDHINEIEREEGKVYCVNLSTLTSQNYLSGKLKTENLENLDENLKVKLAYYNEKVNYDVVKECISSEAYITFDYLASATNKEQSYRIVQSGYYKLEVWGAQGGSYNSSIIGGYGGYSTGVIYLNSGNTLFINVGESGHLCSSTGQDSSYNGGGGCNGSSDGYHYARGGGGATHIALSSGTLASFDTNSDGTGSVAEIKDIVIVAGGGGGSYYHGNGIYGSGGSGGGYIGCTGTNNEAARTPATGGTQTTGGIGAKNGSFGLGAKSNNGGGGGFYGGGATNGGYSAAYQISGAGGGSGYIGNTQLTDAVMYCYNCEESPATATKTINTIGEDDSLDNYHCSNGYNSTPTSKCAKAGNGYAKITFLKEL